MSEIVLNPAKNESKNADVWERALETAGVVALPQREQMLLERWVQKQLWRRAEALVAEFNTAVGADVLYLMPFAEAWSLYGRPSEEHVDRMLLFGATSVDDLVRLISRLEKGVCGVKRAAPTK